MILLGDGNDLFTGVTSQKTADCLPFLGLMQLRGFCLLVSVGSNSFRGELVPSLTPSLQSLTPPMGG